ncbi:MAG TPA: GIY-YIG nuclease family protein [Porticoccaceae bacterium]
MNGTTLNWCVYMIECEDGTLYTGVTTDIARRFREHCEGRRGARYLRGRNPVGVVYLERGHDRGSALRREAEIKGWRKKDKVGIKQLSMDIF